MSKAATSASTSSSSRKRKLSVEHRDKDIAPPQEKRAARYRSKPTADVVQRIHRAISQRLYLLDQRDTSCAVFSKHFAVLGSTGNVYEVDICQKPSCTCPDFQRGHLCKHILFVFLKVLRVPSRSPLIYQKALLQSELEDIFTNAPRQVTAAVNAKACVSQAYRESVLGEEDSKMDKESEDGTKAEAERDEQVLSPLEGECAVCFDPMESRADTTSCPACKNHLHTGCLKQWLKHSRTCVYCRSPLVAASASASSSSKSSTSYSSPRPFEGYVNLGDMQGQSRSRDTSTYNDRSFSMRWR